MIFKRCLLILLPLLLIAGCGGDSSSESNDTTPDSFSFEAKSDVELSTLQTSNSVRISGIDSQVQITIENGSYALNGAEFTSEDGVVSNNDDLVIQHESASEYGSTVITTVEVGGVSATFESTTLVSSDNVAPTVIVDFPNARSWTSSQDIVVRGKATDESGIASVFVNDVEATLHSATDENNTNSGEVEWEAVVAIEPGQLKNITVDAVDNVNNTSENAASVQVASFYAPYRFAYNTEKQELYGCVKDDETKTHLLQITDLSTNIQSLPLEASIGAECQAVFYNASDNSVVLIQKAAGSLFSYRIYYIDDNTLTEPSNVTTDLPPYSTVSFFEYSPTSHAIYFSVYSFENGPDDSNTFDSIYNHDIALGTTSLVTTEQNNTGINFRAFKFISVGNQLFTYGQESGLMSINPTTGERNWVFESDELNQVHDLVANPLNTDQLYAVGYQDAYLIDLSTQSLERINDEQWTNHKSFQQMGSLVADSENGRLLASFIFSEVIGAIDLQTGNREVLLQTGIGQGIKLGTAKSLALSADDKTAYVVDNNGFGLISIDMDTGHRTLLAEGFTYGTYMLALDEANNRLLVQSTLDLVSVSLEDFSVTELSGPNTVSGPEMGRIADAIFDKANNRVIALDDEFHSVVAINIADGSRVTLSSENIGSGPLLPASDRIFQGIMGISYNEADNEIYFGGAVTGEVFSVDLATGDRTIIPTNCRAEEITSSLYLKHNNSLVIAAYPASIIDLTTNECSTLSHQYFYELEQIKEGEIIATGRGGLSQIDLATGSTVVISR